MTPSLVAQPASPPRTKFTIASDARVSARLVGLGLPLPRLPGPSNSQTRVKPDKADVGMRPVYWLFCVFRHVDVAVGIDHSPLRTIPGGNDPPRVTAGHWGQAQGACD